MLSISRSRVGIVAAFAAIYLLWGSTYLAVAVALPSVPPFLLMGTRSLAGGAALLAWAWLTRTSMGSAGTWGRAAVCGLFFFVGCHGVLAYCQQQVPSGLAAILLATIPFWIALLNTVASRDKGPLTKMIALLVPGLAGVALIAGGQVATGPVRLEPAYILYLLGASASWAVGTMLSRRFAGKQSPVAFSGMELITGGLVLVVLGGAFGELSRFDPGKLAAPSVTAWLYLTFAGTVVGFAAYTWLLDRVSPTLVATYTFVNPIIAVLLGWWVLGEQPTAWMIVGAALVVGSVAGLLLFNSPYQRPKQFPQRAAAKS